MMLMAVAFLPFPTAVLSEALHSGKDLNIAVAFYGGTLAINGLFVNLTWRHAVRRHLLAASVTAAEVRSVARHYLVGLIVYALAAIAGLFVPVAALAAYAFLNFFYLWPRSRS
jgi:uncharacterized membrane protein